MNLRIPPHNLDIEQAVLGGMMQSIDAIEVFAEKAKPDIFYREAHQTIAGCIIYLFKEKIEANILTIIDKLKKYNKLDEVGGPAYVSTLAETIPSMVIFHQHLDILQEYHDRRKLIEISIETMNACYDSDETATEIIAKTERRIQESKQHLDVGFTMIGEEITATFEQIEKNAEKKGTITGLPTGFHDLDFHTAGLQPADFILLAGRPSMGKSALAANIMRNAATEGVRSAIFSLEMSKFQMTMRMLSSESSVPLQAMRLGDLQENHWQKLSRGAGVMSEYGIWVDESTDLTPTTMRAKARQLVKKHGIQLIVVDYIQLMKADEKNMSREREISEISRSCKLMAKELNIPVLALSQLNRSLEQRTNKRPILSDLRESGSLEQDSDMVIMIYRDEVYNDRDDNPNKGIAEIIIRKQRMGPTGSVDLVFQSTTATFRSHAGATY